MSASATGNNFPKLHNAAWPGVVGKGSEGGEPFIDLDTMLNLTAGAQVDGKKFDGVDLFLFAPHVDIDSTDDDLKRLADKVRAKNLVIGSVVAPVWPPTGGGSAMGSQADRKQFVDQVRKGCRIARKLRELGIRPYGIVRIDSASGPADWLKDPEGNQHKIAETFRQACDIAADHGERLAAEGEICWGGMHSWKRMVQLLELTNRPGTIGFQADMAHTLLYTLGYNAPEDRILPENWNWSDPAKLDSALATLTAALRPWTIDFHVAQNDATVKGSGSHDKTGKHCLPNDPNGKLDIARHAGFWLRDEKGNVTRAVQHVCWDGCMFPKETMMQPGTWKNVLSTMIGARNAERAKGFAANWGYESIETDWRKLVERKDIDLIDIASPNDTHHDIAIAAARAGKIVMCEKPLGRNAGEAEAMVAAVESARVPNMVWYNYRRVPAVVLIKQLIDEGKLGRIFHYRAKFLQDWTISQDLAQGGEGLWRLDVGVAGSGVTGDLLAHCIDTAIWLNGSIAQVTAMTETFIKARTHTLTGKVEPVGIDDASAFLCRFANGSLALFEATRYARGHKALYTLEINGEHASDVPRRSRH